MRAKQMKRKDTFKCGVIQSFTTRCSYGVQLAPWGYAWKALVVSNYSIYCQSWLSTNIPKPYWFGVKLRSLIPSLANICRLFRRGKSAGVLGWWCESCEFFNPKTSLLPQMEEDYPIVGKFRTVNHNVEKWVISKRLIETFSNKWSMCS